ncbi:YitT family protein, partial [Staphylococcus epidermidis]|uniref:YitT family protein n=1 Tax=Staphylococcus epidermidis TaxID=1282 RepID=UPI0021B17C62
MLPLLLSTNLPFPTTHLILFLNTFLFILLSTLFPFKPPILSPLPYFIPSKLIHIIQQPLTPSKTFKIITKHYDIINK